MRKKKIIFSIFLIIIVLLSISIVSNIQAQNYKNDKANSDDIERINNKKKCDLCGLNLKDKPQPSIASLKCFYIWIGSVIFRFIIPNPAMLFTVVGMAKSHGCLWAL